MILCQFRGYSGSRVELVKENHKVFVRKTGNIQRNYKRLSHLESQGYPVSRIINRNDNSLDIEYIHGLDMLNYLQQHDPSNLIDFLTDILQSFAGTSQPADYTEIYTDKFSSIDFDLVPFTREDLINRLPKFLPRGDYHGDLTLENIIYSESRGFVLIDAVDIEYDGYRFDLAKLAQDLVAKWFLRNTRVNLDFKLQKIWNQLMSKFGIIEPELVISQLLRVYRHTGNDILTRNFLLNRIGTLWKS